METIRVMETTPSYGDHVRVRETSDRMLLEDLVHRSEIILLSLLIGDCRIRLTG